MRYALLISVWLVFSVGKAADIPVGSLAGDNLFMLSRELYGRSIIDCLEYGDPSRSISGDLSRFEEELWEQYNQLCESFAPNLLIPGMKVGLLAADGYRYHDDAANYVKLLPLVRIDFSSKLSANIHYALDKELTNDPRYRGKSWGGFAGLAENATLDYRTDDFVLRFGIETVTWGFGQGGNLLFSRQAMPMTVLGAGYRRWIFDFESLVGFLEPLSGQVDATENDTSFFTSQQRYISAHSITLRPFSRFSLSLREAVLYGGPGRRLEPAYAFPFLWYHGQQLNSGLDDNTLASISADYRLPHRLWLYSEILIDDFQIEKKTRGDYEPNQIAYLGGLEIYNLPIMATTVSLEYARIDNWTYNQARAQNRYINANFPIGFPDGPDSYRFDWRLSWWKKANLRLSYVGSLSYRGEGRIDSPWTAPWLEVDNYSEQFPTGVVERKAVNQIEILLMHKNNVWGNIELKHSDIDNVSNAAGSHDSFWEFDVDIGINLPPVSWGF